MRRTLALWAPSLLTLAVAAAPGLGQGTITDPPALFQRNGPTFGIDADLKGVSSLGSDDHLTAVGWWYRLAADSQEHRFGIPFSQQYSGDTSTLLWEIGIFVAEEVSTIVDTGGPSGLVVQRLTLTNLLAVVGYELDIFHMADIDVRPNFGNDSAGLTWTRDHILITDPLGNYAQYRGIGADDYLVRPFGIGSVASMLDDADIDDFDSTGLPFGPGDVTAGFQWKIYLPPGGSASITVVFSVNDNAPIGCPLSVCPYQITGILGEGSADWPSISGQQIGRVQLDATNSTCSQLRPCQTINQTLSHQFDAYAFTNPSELPLCLSAGLEVLTPSGCDLQLHAYLDTYVPDGGNPCLGYLGGSGQATGVGVPSSLAFSTQIPPSGRAILVVNQVQTGAPTCEYRISSLQGYCSAIFVDRFESGDTSAWSAAVP